MKTEYFSEQFLADLPDDDDEAIRAIALEFERFSPARNAPPVPIAVPPPPISRDKPSIAQPYLDTSLIEACALIEVIVEARRLDIVLPKINPGKIDRGALRNALSEAVSRANDRLSLRDGKTFFETKREHYRQLLSKNTAYEFSDDDFSRIQTLIDEIRTEIQKSALIPPEHKRRMLRRLEAMQSELHKSTADIDRFWGFIAEAGIVARKFGEDLKPLNERIFELGRIVTCAILVKEGIKGLPEIEKLLHLQ